MLVAGVVQARCVVNFSDSFEELSVSNRKPKFTLNVQAAVLAWNRRNSHERVLFYDRELNQASGDRILPASCSRIRVDQREPHRMCEELAEEV